ncbi:DUF222 domain-containing protein [Kribbella ginsengisoli]
MDDRAVETMSGDELLSACDAIEATIEELLARRHRVLHRLDEIRYAEEIGAHDTARLIEKRYRLDPAEARRRVRLALALPKYPAVAAALPAPGDDLSGDTLPGDDLLDDDLSGGDLSGDDVVVLSSAQADAIVSALEKLPKRANVSVEEVDAAAGAMVQAARYMSPGDLRSMGEQVRNILDTDGPEPREDAARAREEVWVKKADDGVKFGGYLAGENAEKLQTVLQAGAKPHKTDEGEQDPRSRGKRQADALVDVFDIALASGDLPTRGGIKPHIAVTISLNDLLEAGRQATGDLTYGDGLSAGAIRRLACDAGIIPIVLGSDSQPLDVGREFRYVTNGLRNALNQRDKGCVICHAPPIYCDAHHLVSWHDGGVTSLANLVLLCRVDHNSLHDGHWTITIIDNQVHVTRPTWADPPPRNTGRKPDQPSTTPATAPAPTATTPWPPSITTADRPPAATTTAPLPPPSTTDTQPPSDTDSRALSGTGARPPSTTDTQPPSGTDSRASSAMDGRAPSGTDAQPSAVGDTSPAAREADPWSSPPFTNPTPATSDTACWARAASGETAVASPDTNPPARPGWHWSYVHDIGWINPEDAAATDPWGDHNAKSQPPIVDKLQPDCRNSDEPTPSADTTPSERLTITGRPFTGPDNADFDPWVDSA